MLNHSPDYLWVMTFLPERIQCTVFCHMQDNGFIMQFKMEKKNYFQAKIIELQKKLLITVELQLLIVFFIYKSTGYSLRLNNELFDQKKG